MFTRGITLNRSESTALAAIAFVALLPITPLSPQVSPATTVQIAVRLQSSGDIPVAGALVALLDARDSVVAEGLSTESGRRMLRAPPGTYRVRARRIGFLPFISSPVVLPHDGELLLAVETPRVVLQSIVVNSRSQCKRSDNGQDALGVVWDEIDKALRASQLTIDDLSGFGQALTYRTQVAPNGAVISTDTTVYQIRETRPFGAINPVTLATRGYVLGDAYQGWQYFAPDEVVLRSEEFAATHCFRLVRERDRRGEIGVAFEPVPERKVSEIAGVLWVDERTAELRDIIFRFVNAGVFSQFDAGGFTRFTRVPSGAWLVSNWQLRVPLLTMRRSPYSGEQFSIVGYAENGGGILASNRPSAKIVDIPIRKRSPE
jgi:hypothetical protein